MNTQERDRVSSVIVGGARTPMGRLLGAFQDLSAVHLGGVAIAGALEKARLDPAAVEYVIMGQGLQAGAGQLPARQAAVAAGIPMTTPAISVNKVCLSGLNAIAQADQLIRAGEAEIIVAGGMESMTNAPYLLPRARHGYKFGSVEMLDSAAHDGLTDAFDQILMGETTERHNAKLGIGRTEQDEYAARSQQRAAAAVKNGVFDAEIVPVSVAQRRGEALLVSDDEGIRGDTTVEALAKLRPAFTSDGTITAGSASRNADGAAAVVVVSRAKARELGLDPIVEIGAYGTVAGPDNTLQSQPANAIKRALARAGRSVEDLTTIEINEAFAAVALQSIRELELSEQRVEQAVNVHGGAIAFGHPLGASGARLALHVVLELQRRGGGFGVAALCGGGGQGDALLFQAP